MMAWRPLPAHAARLRGMLAGTPDHEPGADWYDLPRLIHERHPTGVVAVIGYGSWYASTLRKPQSFPDAYAVVDDYRHVYERRTHVWWNRVLPPNVYFVWSDDPERHVLRGKYNVISTADLERECSPRLRDVYNAGRLTKRVWIPWTRDEGTRQALVARLVDAVCVLTPMAVTLLPERFRLEQFSLELLALSFRGEARLEGWERVRALYEAHAEHYRTLHGLVLDAFGAATGLLEASGSGEYRRLGGERWEPALRWSRRVLRRSRRRGYLRWPRIILTEPNLLDLAVNEAERKAGVRIRVTPRLRRHPLLYGLPEFLRCLRERTSRERIGIGRADRDGR